MPIWDTMGMTCLIGFKKLQIGTIYTKMGLIPTLLTMVY
jgi:hypothetical protein